MCRGSAAQAGEMKLMAGVSQKSQIEAGHTNNHVNYKTSSAEQYSAAQSLNTK
jgi:hypothetical protein